MNYDHTHGYIELYFLVSGGRRYFFNHSIYDIDPGDIVIIARNELHRTAIRGTKGFDRYLLCFDIKDLNAFESELNHTDYSKIISSGCYSFSPQCSSQLTDIFEKLYSEYSNNKKYRDAYIRNYLHQILLILLRHGNSKAPSTGETALKIQQVAEYISSNYKNEITLETASKIACMEKTYFSKRFKKLTGFKFNEYLKEIRLKEAKKMLIETDISISDISQLIGFSSTNYFGDTFKKNIGLSPTQYREKNKTEAFK